MNSKILATKLDFPRALKSTRLEVAHWVIDYHKTFSELLNICFKTDKKISYKAAWILEYVCAEKLEMLLPYLDVFFENIPKSHLDQAVRPFSKICLMLAKQYYLKKDDLVVNSLKSKHKQTMTECCFDWLITNQKVACQAFSMRTLFLIGTEIEWIHPELKTILEQNIYNKSAGYKAQGKQILKEIQKYKSKK